MGNILGNPQISMIFVDYYQSTVGLHVSGKSRILSPVEILGLPNLPVGMVEANQIKGGRRPDDWIVIEIGAAYIHCSKRAPPRAIG